jgi:hypothetical protein
MALARRFHFDSSIASHGTNITGSPQRGGSSSRERAVFDPPEIVGGPLDGLNRRARRMSISSVPGKTPVRFDCGGVMRVEDLPS